MAIAGALLLSFCGGNAPSAEEGGPAGGAPAGGSSQDGSPKTATTSALTEFTIPGRVEAEDFTGFSGPTTSSKGGTGPYSNLEPCSDTSGCGQNVGWIGDGESFSYNVNLQGDVASVDVRVASAYSGRFFLDVDNFALETEGFYVATGGWQNWTTVTISLPLGLLGPGSHVIRLDADLGGFNVNYLDFTARTAPLYRGCRRDDANRALDIFKGSRSDMTPQLCQHLCTGYHYAGVQWYSECWCGDDALGDSLHYGRRPDSECNTPCSGDSSQMCGGGWRNSTYLIAPYVGCYADSSTRALPLFKGYTSDMTPQKCEALCEGYNWAGVQWHGECWCGNTLGYQPRPDSECNEACNGDSTQMCGGDWHSSIYSLADPCYGCWDY